jgi:hypothetical protein
LGGLFLTFYGPKWATPPLFLFKSGKSQQVKLVGKAAKITKKLQIFYVSDNKKFRCIKSTRKYV